MGVTSTAIRLDMAKAAAAAALLALGVSPALAQNLAQNGGFETGDFTGWTQFGDTDFSGVSGEFGGVSPAEGTFQAFFGPTTPAGGGISQTIATNAGRSYTLTFQLANLGSPPNGFGVFWDGAFVDLQFNTNEFPYTQFTQTLTASTGSTFLAFAFYNEPSFFLLDDVSISAVPEPATWAMLIGGFGVIGGTMRRRQRQTVRVSFG